MSVEAGVEWREATGREIRAFYRHEFPEYVDRLPEWITPADPEEFAVALDRRYPVAGDGGSAGRTRQFIRRSTRTNAGPVFPDWDAVTDLFRSPARTDPLREGGRGGMALADPDATPDLDAPVPEAVYYSLVNHERFWPLVFDIDAKDVAADAVREAGDDRTDEEVRHDAGIVDAPPTGYPYRYRDVDGAIDYAFDLAEWLESALDFSDTRVIYSGQGAHVYGLDDDRMHRYTEQSRKFLTTVVSDRLGIPIDEQVTTDERRVVRMPHSLHADVSRVVTPIESREFDFRAAARPGFLGGDAA